VVQDAEVVQLAVEYADANGRLHGILEAVRSNRVEDDFSEHCRDCPAGHLTCQTPVLVPCYGDSSAVV
jgi:hypothetical protein